MRYLIILAFVSTAILSSCSTAYKSGQTPDDVYYSPARETDAYVVVQQDNNRYNSYQYTNPDDNWLRMRVYNRSRWSAFDEYDWNDWRYNSWTYNLYSPYAWNGYWNSYWGWNSFYNPYCSNIIILNPKTNPSVYTKVRNFSLGSYTNTNYNNSNANLSRLRTTYRSIPRPGYTNNNNNSSTLGTSIRRVFSGSGSSYNNANRTSSYNNGNYNLPSNNYSTGGDRPSRSYSPSSSSGSSGGGSTGGSGGGGGGVSRPGRGG
jgi:hypothetical protein